MLDVADQEAAYRPPDEALRQLKGDFALRRPKGLLERVAEQAALVFDSFRVPQPAGVRTAGRVRRLPPNCVPVAFWSYAAQASYMQV